MIHVLVRHHVRDFDEWKTMFDAAVGMRKDLGEVSYELFRDVDDENVVTVRAVFDDDNAARTFFGFGPDGPSIASKKLLAAMMDAGVDEAPQIHFYRRVAGGDL